MKHRRPAPLALSLVASLATACAASARAPDLANAAPALASSPPASPRASAPPRYTPPAQRLGRAQLSALATGEGPRLEAAALARAHRTSFDPVAPLDPGPVEGMRTIQAGRFALDARGLELLRTQRFAVSNRHRFPNFMTGYAMLYIADQPVYLSADAVLNALHESFDKLLADLEQHALAPLLSRGLDDLHRALASPAAQRVAPQTRADLDFYLALARGLLAGAPVAPVAGADAAAVERARSELEAAQGVGNLELFGAHREVDRSQLTPRGHYVGVPALERYFRCVMFLGREGLQLVSSQGGQPVLERRAIEASLALGALLSPEARAAFARYDETVSAFAGEADALGLRDVASLAGALASRPAPPDDAALRALLDAQRGERPRVATTLLHHPPGATRSSFEPVSFSLSPQRYTPDSLVLSRVSYDRIHGGRVLRMMPDPLDAAFGALGNDQALALLEPSLARYDYATELASARALVDAHEASFWSGSLYASWLAALRTLAPREALVDARTLPETMRSEAWGRRLLQTQLAAWAELRHDMVLYAAQSYSAIPGCSYPAAYVDPYPAFWRALDQWALAAQRLVQGAPWSAPAPRARWERWAAHAHSVLPRLEAMAQRERDGLDLTTEQLAYMNQAVNARTQHVVCTTITTVDAGWFYELYEPRLDLGDDRSVVADVHTQPADEEGNTVGRVLHVGTGAPRMLAVIAGPPGRQRAYLGLASSYLERVTERFERLTDQRWRDETSRSSAPPWAASLAAP